MKKYTLLLSPLLLGLWSTAAVPGDAVISNFDAAGVEALPVDRMSGKDVAVRLAQNYNNDVQDCGAGKPAYLCSGITLRGTSPKTGRFALDPSPASVTSGGVSFSYLRKDAAFTSLAYFYENGYILHNKMELPAGVQYNLNSLCYFPGDAGSGVRTDSGCGAHKTFPETSGPCQDQGVTTAEQWVEHFNKAPAGSIKLHHQCGFNIRESGKYDSAAIFRQGLLARNMLPEGTITGQNEIRIATWDTTKESGYPKNFPVQAFFYLYTGEDSRKITGSVVRGINGARYDQFLFYEKTGIWVPVIRITLPQNNPDEAKFEFIASEQHVPEPVDSTIVSKYKNGLYDENRRCLSVFNNNDSAEMRACSGQGTDETLMPQWQLSKSDDGYYLIKNKYKDDSGNDNRCLRASDSDNSVKMGACTTQEDAFDYDSMRYWNIIDSDTGYIRLENKYKSDAGDDNRCLRVFASGNTAEMGACAGQGGAEDDDSMRFWKFEAVQADTVADTEADCRIKSNEVTCRVLSNVKPADTTNYPDGRNVRISIPLQSGNWAAGRAQNSIDTYPELTQQSIIVSDKQGQDVSARCPLTVSLTHWTHSTATAWTDAGKKSNGSPHLADRVWWAGVLESTGDIASCPLGELQVKLVFTPRVINIDTGNSWGTLPSVQADFRVLNTKHAVVVE